MTLKNWKIYSIFGSTLRKIVESNEPDAAFLYMYMMLNEDMMHVVHINELTNPYNGIGWSDERINEAINTLLEMRVIERREEKDEESGGISNEGELYLSDAAETDGEIASRMKNWVFGADIRHDANRMEKEAYENEFYTYDERKSMDVEDKLLFENLSLKIQNDTFFVFEVSLNEGLVSFAPVNSIIYGTMVRDSEHMRFLKVDEMKESVVVGLIRRLVHLSDDDVILAMYDGSNNEDDSSYSTIGIFKDSDGGSISDTHCKYIVGVDKETAKRLMETEEECVEGFTYFYGLLND